MHPCVLALLCLPLLAPHARSQTCPDPRDIRAEMEGLLSLVQSAGSEREAAPYVGQMWALWQDAPDPHAQELLQQGIESIRLTDHRAAEATLSTLIAYCPTYPEATINALLPAICRVSLIWRCRILMQRLP